MTGIARQACPPTCCRRSGTTSAPTPIAASTRKGRSTPSGTPELARFVTREEVGAQAQGGSGIRGDYPRSGLGCILRGMHRSWRLLVPLLAALAAGCGGLGDEKPTAPHNDAGRSDGVPIQLDTQSLLPDTSPVSPDTTAMADAGGLDTEGTEAGDGTSTEAGGETGKAPASV